MKSPVEIQHPHLGLVSGEDGLWTGRVQQDGRDIPFVVAGTEAGPDPHLLERLLDLLTNFRDVEACALQFLCPQDPAVPAKPGDFTFQSFDLLWPQKPECFTLEFALDGDDGSIWRVEFHNGHPYYTGRDD
jgi:hypothetical protein